MNSVLDEMRRGVASRVVVDAIVILATRLSTIDGALTSDSEGLVRGVNLAAAVRDLSDASTMRNGVRWRSIPIVLLVDDRDTARNLLTDPHLTHVAYHRR
ncbi:MAG TPA: hypothetical protein VII30_06270 [Gemmatimonadaceae bacterium]